MYEHFYNQGGNFFEEIIELIYKRFITKGDTVIDGGAHIGRHTLPLSRSVTTEGLVYAFEPLPTLFSDLQSKLRSQGCNQVTVSKKALSNKIRKTSFCHIIGANGYSGLKLRQHIPVEFLSNITYIEQSTTTLDFELYKIHDRKSISFIKLDLEGGEYNALLGSKKILSTERPLVIFENGDEHAAETYSYRLNDFAEFLKNHRYYTYDLFGRVMTLGGKDKLNYRPWYCIAVPFENNIINTYIRLNLLNDIDVLFKNHN